MIQFLSLLANVFCYFIPICIFLPFKLRLREKAGLFLLLLINLGFMSYGIGNIGVIFLLLSTAVYIALIHKNHLLNLCILIATYLFCVLCDNIFSVLWNTYIFQIYPIQPDSISYLTYCIAYIVMLLILCPVIAVSLRRIVSKLHLEPSSRLLVPISLNLVFCLFIFLFNIITGESLGYSTPVILFNCVLFGCYFIFSIFLTIQIVKSSLSDAERKMRQSSFDALQNYTNQVENMYSTLRSFKHDYNNVMLSMSGFIENDDMEGLRDFFDNKVAPINKQLTKNAAHLNQLMNIKIPELKSLISAKLLYAAELNINITLEIETEITALPMDSIDLARVLGIFLDNAIEAALETEKPVLKFLLYTTGNTCTLLIQNTYVDKGLPVSEFKKNGVSTKGPTRGIGLSNANQILQKYSHIQWSEKAEENMFTQQLRISE